MRDQVSISIPHLSLNMTLMPVAHARPPVSVVPALTGSILPTPGPCSPKGDNDSHCCQPQRAPASLAGLLNPTHPLCKQPL